MEIRSSKIIEFQTWDKPLHCKVTVVFNNNTLFSKHLLHGKVFCNSLRKTIAPFKRMIVLTFANLFTSNSKPGLKRKVKFVCFLHRQLWRIYDVRNSTKSFPLLTCSRQVFFFKGAVKLCYAKEPKSCSDLIRDFHSMPSFKYCQKIKYLQHFQWVLLTAFKSEYIMQELLIITISFWDLRFV